MTARAELEELVDRHMSALSDDERALACGVAGVARVQAIIARLADATEAEIQRELEEGVALIDAGTALLGASSATATASVYGSFVLSFRSLATDLLARLSGQ